ncbi:mRNA interferase RelE/StbE [Alkalihalobacillus xiaoxiensis]|uniref:mRNA interferase RelE/StbE n=1 Tax=Shouchella xiaoxiensis TaxID=766895 RepID=A0ABS2SXN8_9BACI|nr:hypothetical protein [Shouchella xiaoxiensis]MBM7839786.1 mRNA interferase RelE/StbE [Shouchella xiaoxiensis]
MSKRFNVVFLNDKAEKEFNKFDGFVASLLDKAIIHLEERADEIGKELTGNLRGCKEIKLKQAGVRMIYRLPKGYEYLGEGIKLEIVDVQIIATGK